MRPHQAGPEVGAERRRGLTPLIVHSFHLRMDGISMGMCGIQYEGQAAAYACFSAAGVDCSFACHPAGRSPLMSGSLPGTRPGRTAPGGCWGVVAVP